MPVFLPPLYKSFAFENLKCNFPLSSGVFPITVPPCKGTHGDRVAGDNTRSRHNLCHFSHYATTLCAPAPQQHGAVARTTVLLGVRFARRRCGSCSVLEVAHTVYKYAPNKFSFRAQSKNFIIMSEVEGSRGNETPNFFCARATIINYSLFIINYYAVAACVPFLNSRIPFKCAHGCVCVRIMRGRDVGRFLIKV